MSANAYIGEAASAKREQAYIAAEHADELKQLSVTGTPADPTVIILDEEVPF